jgi:hypothetical protein
MLSKKKVAAPAAVTAKARGRNLEAFRENHDRAFIVPKRIRDGLESLGDSWEYEAEFIRRCGVATHEFSTYRDLFADFCIETPSVNGGRPKRVYAGTRTFAAKLRAALA